MATASSTSPEGNGSPPPRRRLTGRAWLLLLVFLAALPLVWLAIFAAVKPTYEASSLLRMTPGRPSPLSAESFDEPTMDRFIETQIAHLKTNQVLDRVLSSSAAASLPSFRNAPDFIEVLRASLKASRRGKSADVVVAWESEDPKEAAEVVNAVVGSYLMSYRDHEAMRTLGKRDVLNRTLEKIDQKFQDRVEALNRLVDARRGAVKSSPEASSKDAPERPPVVRPDSDAYDEKIAERLAQVDAELIEAGSQLGPDEAEPPRMETLRKVRADLWKWYSGRTPKPSETDQVAELLLRRELDGLSQRREEFRRRIEDEELADTLCSSGVDLIDRASVPTKPSSDPRTAYAILASIGLAIVLGGAARISTEGRRTDEPPNAGAPPTP